MYDQPEAQEAMQYLVDKLFVHETSPPAELTKELGGEFGNPFAAGKIGLWPSGRVYSTGYAIPRIKDRFRWTLMPEVIVRDGMAPGHGWNDQANMVTATARTNGTERGGHPVRDVHGRRRGLGPGGHRSRPHALPPDVDREA